MCALDDKLLRIYQNLRKLNVCLALEKKQIIIFTI